MKLCVINDPGRVSSTCPDTCCSRLQKCNDFVLLQTASRLPWNQISLTRRLSYSWNMTSWLWSTTRVGRRGQHRFSMLQEELKVRCEVSVNRSMLADVSLKATTTISVVWQQQWLLWDGSLHTGCSFTNLVIQILHQKYTMSKYYQSSWHRGRWGEGYCVGYTLWCG